MEDGSVKLSIIIVNYNGRRFLDECLDSIRRLVLSSHEVIIVDNASADGSAEYIATHFPEVHLISSAENLGFTGGNNAGARVAKGELLLLLNNDTKLLTSLDQAILAFERAELGVLGVHLFYGDGRNQASVGYQHTPIRILLSWLGLARFSRLPRMFRRTETAPEFYDHDHQQVDWVSGAFLMTRRDLWNSIGGLDERYFMYVEDADYCKQVRNAGFEVAYLPTVKVIHYEGGGKAWVGQNALTRTVNSYRIFLEKHYGPVTALITSIFLSPIMAARVPVYFLRYKLKDSQIDREKFIGYTAAAKLALFGSCAAALDSLRSRILELREKRS